MKQKRRHEGRRIYQTEVEVLAGQETLHYDAIDISPSGLFLATDLLPEEGEELDLQFDLPDGGQRIEARGCVARINADCYDPSSGISAYSGMGIRFTELSEEARSRIVHFARR